MSHLIHSLFSFRSGVVLVGGCFFCALVPQPAGACGGFYDSNVVSISDDELLRMPHGSFEIEIHRLPLPKVPFKWNDKKPIDAHTDDVRAELASQGIDADDPAHRAINANLVNLLLAGNEYEMAKVTGRPELQPREITVSPQLPVEFQDYLSGWLAYKAGRPDAARAAWKRLLDRPKDDRRWLTIAATYMTGQTQLDSDPVAARECFRRTRDLAGAGFHDTQGLAAVSYGEEARTELDQQHFDRAIDLYLQQLATGDPSAIPSLQIVAGLAFKSGEASLRQLAVIPSARGVLTAFAIAQGGPWRDPPNADLVRAWLVAVDAAKILRLDGAERFAWSAYQYGHYDLADQWVKRADDKNPIAQWIAAKLLLRQGKIEPAIKLIAGASAAFPVDDPQSKFIRIDQRGEYQYGESQSNAEGPDRVEGELAVLHLSRADYIESLTLMMHGNWWDDAAYVAERVLTVDELKHYVDQRVSAPPPTTNPTAAEPNAQALRNLLARRLMRLGRWKDARPYFSANLQVISDSYISAIRAGHDDKRSNGDRARSLWAAAQVARNDGMNLLGTELGPDDHLQDGATQWSERNPSQKNNLRGPSPDEIKRLHRPPEQLNKRFHYRYIAADLAWSAAELMPDNTDELAKHLNEAGTWLKTRDPAAAERFYTAMLKRCPDTSLAKQAKKLKWFVPVDEKK